MVKRRTSHNLQTESESELSLRINELERSLSLCQKTLVSKEKELEKTSLHIQINETLIDLAEETFGWDIRKNFDTKYMERLRSSSSVHVSDCCALLGSI